MSENPETVSIPSAVNWRLTPLSVVIVAAGLYGAFHFYQRDALRQTVSIHWEDRPALRSDGASGPMHASEQHRTAPATAVMKSLPAAESEQPAPDGSVATSGEQMQPQPAASESRATNNTGGARLAGRAKMIGALQALQRAHEPKDLPGEFAAFGISGGLGAGIKKMFMSHPPLEERIRALQQNS